MKKNIILLLSIISIQIGVFAQADEELNRIIEKLANTNSYKCECFYSFNNQYFEFNNTMVVLRNPQDSITGYSYHFYRDKNQIAKENESDFIIYNGDAYYISYKGRITKTEKKINPRRFLDSISGDFTRPSIAKSPLLCNVTVFEIEKDLKRSIKDNDVIIKHKSDTIINSTLCFYYEFTRKIKRNIIITSIFFDKQTLYPLLHKVYSNGSFGERTNVASFQHIEANPLVPVAYFLEENLLPLNWRLSNPADTAPHKDMTGQEAPLWELPLLDNDKKISLSQFSGRYVLLEFTATWCGHCWEAAKMMNGLEEKYKDNKNISLVSIYSSEMDTKERILEFVQKNKIKNILVYNAKPVAKLYHIEGYPQFFIIDTKGKIIWQVPGYSKDIEAKINNKLAPLIGL